jgi:uncharacterized protein (DUF1330 family)
MPSLKIGFAVALAFGCGVLVASQASDRKAYMVVQVDVTNPQQYQEYAKLSPDIIARYDGRFLARAGRTETLEGPPARSRVVIVEFPSFARAQQFYRSAEYTAARKLRAGAGDGQFVLVEAVE